MNQCMRINILMCTLFAKSASAVYRESMKVPFMKVIKGMCITFKVGEIPDLVQQMGSNTKTC